MRRPTPDEFFPYFGWLERPLDLPLDVEECATAIYLKNGDLDAAAARLKGPARQAQSGRSRFAASHAPQVGDAGAGRSEPRDGEVWAARGHAAARCHQTGSPLLRPLIAQASARRIHNPNPAPKP